MAFGSRVESAFLTCDANYEFITDGTDAIAIQLNPREAVTLVFNFDAAGTTDDLDIQVLQGNLESTGNGLDGTTDDLDIQVLQGNLESTGNGLDGATGADDLELDTAADGFSTDDDMNGKFIIMTSGDEQGEGKLITDSVASDDGVNLENALTGTPSASETYDLYNLGAVYEFQLDSATQTSDIMHNARVTVDAADGEWVLVRARATGSTDAHRVQMSYQKDGVSI